MLFMFLIGVLMVGASIALALAANSVAIGFFAGVLMPIGGSIIGLTAAEIKDYFTQKRRKK